MGSQDGMKHPEMHKEVKVGKLPELPRNHVWGGGGVSWNGWTTDIAE